MIIFVWSYFIFWIFNLKNCLGVVNSVRRCLCWRAGKYPEITIWYFK